MKRRAAKILAAILAFTIGIGVAEIWKRWTTRTTPANPVHDWNEAEIALPAFALARSSDKTGYPLYTSISPYSIKRLIDQHNQIAEEINLSTGRYQTYVLSLKPIFKHLGVGLDDTDFIDLCQANCKAAIFDAELDGQPGRETLLRLSDSTGWYLYLIFKRASAASSSGATWKFFGVIDNYLWWTEPEAAFRVEKIGEKPFVVVQNNGGHGSGYSLYYEVWYEIGESGVRQVLDCQKNLFAATWSINPGIESNTKIVKTDFKDGVATVVLRFSNKYEAYQGGEDRLPLFKTERRVTFVKRHGSPEFVLDSLASEMSAQELEDLEAFDEGCYLNKFLQYNYRELLKLAAGPEGKLKDWLRDYLDTRQWSPEREALKKALDKEQR